MLQFIDTRLKWVENNQSEGVFSEKVLLTWIKYRQCHVQDKEAGGLLMGRFAQDTQSMLVDDLTTPMFFDKRKRRMFYRSKSHNRELKKYWKNTQGYGGLLGLWHTHPENIPTPSSMDITDLKNQIMASKYVTNRLIYIIVGITHIGVWTGDKNGKVQFIGHIAIDNKIDHHDNNFNQHIEKRL